MYGSKSENFLGDHLEKRSFRVARGCRIGRYEIDLLVEDTVIIEIDGYHHLAKDRRLVDRKKDRYLRGIGYEVMRIPASQVRDPKRRDALTKRIEDIIDSRRDAAVDERPRTLTQRQLEKLEELRGETGESDETLPEEEHTRDDQQHPDVQDPEDFLLRYLDEHFPEEKR